MALDAIDSPFEHDIEIEQGSDFALPITLTYDDDTPLPLTGLTIASKLRDFFGTGSTVLVTFTCNILNAAAGQFEIRLTKVQTAALTRPAGAAATERITSLGVYDIELSDGTYTYRYIQGKATLSAEATY